ncbi:MAG: DUF892 family protein, partial [Pseudomonadota bacterium]
ADVGHHVGQQASGALVAVFIAHVTSPGAFVPEVVGAGPDMEGAVVHYAIAGYGCLAAFANRLELDGDVTALKECLDASYEGDRTMTALATGGINKQAVA